MRLHTKLMANAALLLLAPMALSAQGGQTGNYGFTGAAGVGYQIDYLGSGGASFWNSLWAIQWNGSTLGSRDLLYCKDPGCTTNSFIGTQQNKFDPTYGYLSGTTDVYTNSSNWILGFYVETSGIADTPPIDNAGLWLYSLASLNPGGLPVLHNWGTAGVYYDPTYSVLMPGTQSAGFNAIGLEDISCSTGPCGDQDFNDAVFSIQSGGNLQEVIPEPMTMSLLATGLVGLAGASLRKRTKKA